MRKIASLLTVSMLFCSLAFGQQRNVSGQVRDAQGNGVPFATVTETGTRNAVTADANGNFTIKVANNARLNITAAGYQASTVGADAATAISLTRGGSEQLTEVVVTSLGQARQAKELGYSTAKVRATELTQAAPVNLQNGLTGKVSGLNINTTNAGVFAQTRITLRGIRSLTGNNQPMLILDGVPLSLGFLSSINPNDIADVTILKSSSATAVYGPDGVNGAIVVTTKRGQKGRPQVSVSHTTQLESIAYMPKFQKRFGSGYAPDALGYGTFEPIEQQSWGDPFDGSIRQMGQTGPNGEKLMLPYSYVENGRKNFFNTGVTHQTDVSFSTDGFYLSGQNVSIDGVMPGDQNNRRTFTLKADREYGRFRAGFNLRYTNQQYDVTTNNTLVYYGVTSAPGQYDLGMFSDWRNDYFSSPDGFYSPYLDNNGKTPYFAKDNAREYGKGDDIFGNGELNFKATNWLNFTYRVGLTYANADYKRTREPFQYSAFHNTLRDHGTANITGAVTNGSTLSNRFTSELFATANKTFGAFGVNALVGHSYRESRSRFLSLGSNNLGTATAYTIALRKGEPNVDVDNSVTRLERYFGRVSFDFNKWAFIEATGSYDFDSRLVKPGVAFEKSDIGYFYPGVSASVVLSDAIPALKSNKILNYAKIRGAITKTGNVNLSAYGFENVFAAGTFFPFNDVLGFQATTTTVAAQYRPEYVNNREVGLELGFLNNRINVEATYYNQDNTDQVINVQQSNTTGATTAIQNAGSFINKGFEIDLRLTPLVKLGNVNVDFKVNYSNQDSKVTSLIGDVKELGIGNFNYAVVGQPAYVFQVSDYQRDDQGRVIVDAQTGMPTIAGDLARVGRTMPKHILGLNLNVTWKGLSFSAVADYRAGNKIVADQLGGFLDDNGISERSAQADRRAFIFPNSVVMDGSGKYVTNTNVYTQTYGRLFWNSDLNTGVETNYVASGAFWKIREVALNYTIPTRIFGARLGNVIKGATIGVNARNLLMFLPKSNVWTDPEFSANGNNAYTGNAVGRSTAFNMPPTRIYGANLTLRF
ncbi:SusC/RagA family TonB-linked outer membrane protein [Flaviaesturariibacter amylovorans]|uniref:SusC/RagA family TonB-linked outer membrane protein n=1 Tax=Flaviaesturariibacter amylovorans TaxID=1084520 RepID=A0ABP8G8U5_9BACT